jgi:hypothetical protein
LIWQVYSTTVTKFLPTIYKPIDLTIDIKTRKAQAKVAGVVEGTANAIINGKSGKEVHTKLSMPSGFEFTEAEFVDGVGRTLGAEIKLNFDHTHSHLARFHWSTNGVVR